jgi:hypothetical protein
MKPELCLSAAAVLAVASFACSGGEPSDDVGGPVCDSTPELVVTDPVNNYSFQSTLTFPPITVKPDSELTFDWSTVTTDFLGHSFDPMTDVDSVHLMLWTLSQDELETKLNADTLLQRDLAIIAKYETEKATTSVRMFDFVSPDNIALEPCNFWPYLQLPMPDPAAHPECEDWAENAATGGFDQAQNSYTVMIASGTELGAGTRMIQGFKLDAASENTHVALELDSTHLEWSVDMEALKPTPVPAGTGEITIDWTDMLVTALGTEFLPNNISEALVARYDEPIAELEDGFLDLELLAEEVWRGEITAGTTATLSSFTNEAGEPFAGINGSGTWIVALFCGRCRNPAPWYLTTLTTCSQ